MRLQELTNIQPHTPNTAFAAIRHSVDLSRLRNEEMFTNALIAFNSALETAMRYNIHVNGYNPAVDRIDFTFRISMLRWSDGPDDGVANFKSYMTDKLSITWAIDRFEYERCRDGTEGCFDITMRLTAK